ncbi:MAG: aspartate kinase [Bacteroidota bacterium]
MIVMKFGGTSNEDAAAMSNVVRIVKSHLSFQPVVVISAIAKATNELEKTARIAALGDETEAIAIVSSLFERHTRIIDNLIKSRSSAAELEAVLFHHLNEIKAIVKGISILRELTPRSKDAICSYGERLSSRIVAVALQEAGVKALWVDARDFMVTDENFGRAEPIVEIVEQRLKDNILPLISAGSVPVTQGFIGVTHDGAYTTMGRESSDYSASIIAAAMNADRVQIWTDVDGILTCDPRVIKNPRKIRQMTFAEAFELSYFGAKVLHPNTMLPVLEKGIPVQILNSKREASTGTWVNANPGAAAPVIKSIAYKNNMVIVTVSPKKRLNQYLFWEGVFNILNRHNVLSGLMVTSEYSISLALEQKYMTDGLLHELQKLGTAHVMEKKGSVCLVGDGIRSRSNIIERVFGSLGSMNVALISFGASDSSLTFVIDEDQIPEALNRLHEEFFNVNESSEIFEEVPPVNK